VADQLYGLTAQQVMRLKGLLAAWENGELRAALGQRRQPPYPPHAIEFGKADATISGVTAAGSTPYSGTISVFSFTTLGNTTDTGMNLTAWNFSTVQITTEQWVQLERHGRTGQWIIGNSWDHCRKPFIRIKYTTAVTTGTSSYSAAVMEQWGPGISHTATTITTYNLVASTGFVFSGTTGKMGIAVWDSSTNYRHIQGECT